MASLRYPLKTSTDITIAIPEEKKTRCEICDKECSSPNALAGHIGAKHRVKFEDYLVQYYNNNIHPLCPVCSEPTRYLRGEYSFKKYCVKHADESRKEWSLQKGFGNNSFDHNWRSGQTKSTNESIAKQSESISGKNNPSFLTEEDFNDKIKFILGNDISVNLTYQQYNGEQTVAEGNCNSCKRKIIKKFINLVSNPSCPSCMAGKSREEQEVYNHILQYHKDAERCVKNVIAKELDIYVKHKNFAVEYNGLFWHTAERIGKDYHSDKTKFCDEKGINLFHIFSDEWLNKKDIVKSMINYRLGITSNRIYARNCDIKSTDTNSTLSDFFNSTHISGHTQYMKAFYLTHKDKIVCALSLRKSFHSKYDGMIEIARFSSLLDTNVIGGFGKLLKEVKKWATSQGYSGILTYADLRFGKGDVYKINGFQLIDKTKPDYWYTDTRQRYNRFQYRAQPGKPEKQVAEEAGVQKVYGCGSNIYLLKLQ